MSRHHLVLNGCLHLVTGIGVVLVHEVLNCSILDQVIPVTDQGAMTGVSSEAALHAALVAASCQRIAGNVIGVILADTGERNIATSLFGLETGKSAIG